MLQISRGGYSQEVPVPVTQHKCRAGGHPGCGGYVEVIELELPGIVNRFVLQEYPSLRDYGPNGPGVANVQVALVPFIKPPLMWKQPGR